jgi:hypothetical protein
VGKTNEQSQQPKTAAKKSQQSTAAPKKPRTAESAALVYQESKAPAWHRRAEEGEKAYHAFCYYYALSPHGRSVDAAYKEAWRIDQESKKQRWFEQQRKDAERHQLSAQQAKKRSRGKTTGSKRGANEQQKPFEPKPFIMPPEPKRASGRWFEWCSKFHWVERAIKHDQHQAEQRAKKNFDRVFKRLEKQQLDIEAVQQLGASWIYNLILDKRFGTLSYEQQIEYSLAFMRMLPQLQQAERDVSGVIQAILNNNAKMIFTEQQQ